MIRWYGGRETRTRLIQCCPVCLWWYGVWMDDRMIGWLVGWLVGGLDGWVGWVDARWAHGCSWFASLFFSFSPVWELYLHVPFARYLDFYLFDSCIYLLWVRHWDVCEPLFQLYILHIHAHMYPLARLIVDCLRTISVLTSKIWWVLWLSTLSILSTISSTYPKSIISSTLLYNLQYVHQLDA